MPKKDLQLAPMHRIIKNAGAERVGDDAAEALRDILENVGLEISKDALDFTKHARRKTVKAVDIQIAAKKLLER